jgi:hypothetical protein
MHRGRYRVKLILRQNESRGSFAQKSPICDSRVTTVLLGGEWPSRERQKNYRAIWRLSIKLQVVHMAPGWCETNLLGRLAPILNNQARALHTGRVRSKFTAGEKFETKLCWKRWPL